MVPVEARSAPLRAADKPAGGRQQRAPREAASPAARPLSACAPSAQLRAVMRRWQAWAAALTACLALASGENRIIQHKPASSPPPAAAACRTVAADASAHIAPLAAATSCLQAWPRGRAWLPAPTQSPYRAGGRSAGEQVLPPACWLPSPGRRRGLIGRLLPYRLCLDTLLSPIPLPCSHAGSQAVHAPHHHSRLV